MKILIVDDMETNRDLIKQVLIDAGYAESSFLFEESADKAFNLLGIDGSSEPPDTGYELDLVLMDIAMPGTDGIEACKKIKSTERFQDTPVIMVSAMSDTKLLLLSFNAGAVDFIAKPLNIDEFVVRVRSALKTKQRIDQLKSQAN
ncbi:MAG: response regulator [Proteobacteria bacterium]|nr:response regulator [Pseudomonadota bacterium]